MAELLLFGASAYSTQLNYVDSSDLLLLPCMLVFLILMILQKLEYGKTANRRDVQSVQQSILRAT